MKFEVHLPCDQLLAFVKHLIISENESSASYKVLPDTELVMGFQYSGKLSNTDNGRGCSKICLNSVQSRTL
jgi:hypothetical protein